MQQTKCKREPIVVQAEGEGGVTVQGGCFILVTKKDHMVYNTRGVKLVLYGQDGANHLLVFAFFRVYSARAGAPATLGRSTPSCRRLVVRVGVLKKCGAEVCGSNIARG